MKKRILFLVVGKKKTINEETKKSIQTILGKEDAIVYIQFEDEERTELYYSLLEKVNHKINTVNNFDYVCLIPNEALVSECTRQVFDYHQLDRTDESVVEIYLPLALYNSDDTIVVMNKQVWNSMLAYSPGILDIDLALKQIDSTIFGAFIPVSIFFDPAYYNENLKYYQQFYILNNLTDGDNLVVGIPKIALTIKNWDFKMENIENKDKLEMFNMARDKWKKESIETEKNIA